MLRVPGTWNHKYDPPRPVAFVRAEWERLYSLPDLETACTPKSERILIAQTKSEPNDEFWLNKALEKAQPGNRNATGFALACQLRDAGLTEIDATAVMRRYAVLVAGPGYAESEALASLGQAYGISPRKLRAETATTATAIMR